MNCEDLTPSLHDAPPTETGEDGRAVMEIIFAAYESARTGKRVDLPFNTKANSPHEQWMKGKSGQ